MAAEWSEAFPFAKDLEVAQGVIHIHDSYIHRLYSVDGSQTIPLKNGETVALQRGFGIAKFGDGRHSFHEYVKRGVVNGELCYDAIHTFDASSFGRGGVTFSVTHFKVTNESIVVLNDKQAATLGVFPTVDETVKGQPRVRGVSSAGMKLVKGDQGEYRLQPTLPHRIKMEVKHQYERHPLFAWIIASITILGAGYWIWKRSRKRKGTAAL